MQKEKITIVLLPGLNGTEGLFKRLVDGAPDIFDVVCLSYPTHEMKSYAELTSLVMSRLKSVRGNYILVGESFSGPIAIFISHKNPKGLLGTILVATFVSPPYAKIGKYLPWTLGFKLMKPLYSVGIALSKRSDRSILKAACMELQKVHPKVLAYRVNQAFAVNAQVELKECPVPVAYFRGSRDFIVPKWNLKEISKIKPDIKIITFRSSHFLLQSKPLEAWEAISRFASEFV